MADQRRLSLDELLGQLEDKHQRLAASPAVWPAEGWLTSRFGTRISPFTGKRQFHSGIDIAGARFIQADIENGPWPLEGETFEGIVVTNYLHRPLFPKLKESLKEGGVLIYETFMAGNERFGRPSNPAFLLQPGELRDVFGELQLLGFEEGPATVPKPAVIQRLCAMRSRTV